MPIDFNFYNPSDLEIAIERCYRKEGILSPIDLTIRNVSHAFNVDVEYYDGKPFADWIGSRGIVVLNQKDDIPEQRSDFFHEVGHCVLHVGNQKSLNSLFVDLQEAQSSRFQYYAAMPVFMIAQFSPTGSPTDSWKEYYAQLAEAFILPVDLVERRIIQIKARIDQEKRDIAFKSILSPKKSGQEYSADTIRILRQLQQQLQRREGVAAKQ